MLTRLGISSLMVAAALAWGCSKKENPAPQAQPVEPAAPAQPAQPIEEDPRMTARNLFKARCVVCHGESGKGDGPAAAALNPKPRDYTDPEWQKSVTDDQLKKTILEGGAAVGKSPIMPGNPDLADKPKVVDELAAMVRGFAKK